MCNKYDGVKILEIKLQNLILKVFHVFYILRK